MATAVRARVLLLVAGVTALAATTTLSDTADSCSWASRRTTVFAVTTTPSCTRLPKDGAEIVTFSPLADEPPPSECDACWLPGGYPELHAGALAAAARFRAGLTHFAQTRPVHGEPGARSEGEETDAPRGAITAWAE